MSVLGVSMAVETSEINIAFNTTNLLVFLTGMYTIIYFATIYVYVTKKSSKNHTVSVAVTILYASSIVATASQWYGTKLEFVDSGDTRDSIFISLYETPQWLYVAFSASTYIVFIIADGLLIWRCFYVWNRSFRIISIPLLLIITEMGLFMANTVFHIIYTNVTLPSLAAAKTFNNVLSAAFFTSFFTTLLTTTFIAYGIYSASQDGGIPMMRFKHIIDIVVQSGAVYALTLLVTAISNIVPQGNSVADDPRLEAFDDYIRVINYPITGMLATIMVARVTLSAETRFPSTVVDVSGLQFRARSTHQTGTEVQ